MWMPPPAANQIKISSMIISQGTNGQHIPARKAHRSPPIPFASRAIFVNVTTLLNPSIAEQIPKDQKSNNPPPCQTVGRVDASYRQTAA